MCLCCGVLPPVHLSSSGQGSGLHSSRGRSHVTSELRAPDKEAHSVTLSALPARTHERVTKLSTAQFHLSICGIGVQRGVDSWVLTYFIYWQNVQKLLNSKYLQVPHCKIQREVVSLEASRRSLEELLNQGAYPYWAIHSKWIPTGLVNTAVTTITTYSSHALLILVMSAVTVYVCPLHQQDTSGSLCLRVKFFDYLLRLCFYIFILQRWAADTQTGCRH